ncbi:MAG TPA: glutamine-hydrolyzing GMP synthase, partial [bacterium]|nr:glutamine-hydrolyzing GMP synthase [bacterium]
MKKVLILDFGSQYTQLIARKVRELGVFSEIYPFDIPVSVIKKSETGAIILSGGPQSVYEEGAPLISADIFRINIPILGICYGLQLMAFLRQGKVIPSKKREYGLASLKIYDRRGILNGIEDFSRVWMSHGDKVIEIPPGFIVSAVTENCETAVIENIPESQVGVQFHPEVIHTEKGMDILANFLFSTAGLKPEWNMGSFLDQKTEDIQRQVGSGRVICGLSGGVDSLVASLIIHKAIGDRLYCVFVDNGLLRKGQFKDLMNQFRSKFSLIVKGVDASDQFLEKLRGITSPERKRKVIGREFISIFEKEAEKITGVDFLAQGTIYPDVIESSPVKGPSASIKSHHN